MSVYRPCITHCSKNNSRNRLYSVTGFLSHVLVSWNGFHNMEPMFRDSSNQRRYGEYQPRPTAKSYSGSQAGSNK
ncbi:hypothetical protein TNCV_3721431 [Trichonephila clavipes]|nr:hypothetical protein TNCV_3721431 [Trichonephila clavipes]